MCAPSPNFCLLCLLCGPRWHLPETCCCGDRAGAPLNRVPLAPGQPRGAPAFFPAPRTPRPALCLERCPPVLTEVSTLSVPRRHSSPLCGPRDLLAVWRERQEGNHPPSPESPGSRSSGATKTHSLSPSPRGPRSPAHGERAIQGPTTVPEASACERRQDRRAERHREPGAPPEPRRTASSAPRAWCDKQPRPPSAPLKRGLWWREPGPQQTPRPPAVLHRETFIQKIPNTSREAEPLHVLKKIKCP